MASAAWRLAAARLKAVGADSVWWAAPAARLGASAGRTGIVLASAVIVAGLVASIVMGPLGDRVLAQDGYGKRERDGAGIIAAMFEADRPMRRAAAPSRRHELVAAAFPASYGEDPQWRAPHPRADRHTRAAASPVAASDDVAYVVEPGPDVARLGGGSAVCVRLCDGYYFPMGDIRGQGDVDSRTALCSGLCPGAPTRLFVTPGGSDDMSRATAVDTGQAYPGLAVAYAHTKEVGPTCACHPTEGQQTARVSPLTDFTLRRGDSIMTPVGWRVFQGADHWPYRRDDFRSIETARNLTPQLRSTLAAIEEASLGRRIAGRLPPLVVTRRMRVAAWGSGDRTVVDGMTTVRRVGGSAAGTP